MQPNFQTEFQMIANQQGNTAISSKRGSFKNSNAPKGEGTCFLGMLNKVEGIPVESILDLKELQEKSQLNENILGMVVKTEQGICFLTCDTTLKGENIPELSLETEQNKEGNEEQPPSSKASGQDLLKSGNEKGFLLFRYSGNTKSEASPVEKNTMVVASNNESDPGAKKSALSEILNISVKTEENGQGELDKNNAGVQVLKGSEGSVGKEAGAQLLKGLGADITKNIKNSNTKSSRADADIKPTADLGDAEKTVVTDRIVMEGKTFQLGVEEPKTYNSLNIFNEELKSSELSKKDLLLKIAPDVKEKDQQADSSKGENTSDEKASPQDKEFINLKETGLKIKASVTQSSAEKMIQPESESKNSGNRPSENISGDKSLEEMMPGRENRLASTISRAGTLNQMVQKAALNLKNGKSQVRIDLKPEFLGSVRLKITTENQLVTVRILTELPVVKEVIESNLGQLKTDLQNQGMEIDKLDVFVANDSQQHGKGFDKADFLSEKENNDSEDHKTVSADETRTVSLLKESTAANGLDFFA